jgi:hypothetical protein
VPKIHPCWGPRSPAYPHLRDGTAFRISWKSVKVLFLSFNSKERFSRENRLRESHTLYLYCVNEFLPVILHVYWPVLGEIRRQRSVSDAVKRLWYFLNAAYRNAICAVVNRLTVTGVTCNRMAIWQQKRLVDVCAPSAVLLLLVSKLRCKRQRLL